MSTLTVTARGQVTLRKSLLRHLGIKPGDKITVDLLPDGRAALRSTKPSGSIEALFGILAEETNQVATIEEIKRATEEGWAGLL